VSQSPFKHFLGEDLPQFAHPAEAEFARLLDANGLPWDYEPHTFVLAYSEDGRLVEAFTPDFFLPTADLYVELSVAMCKHLTRKRRKVRRAIERHGLVIVLHERPHFERLCASYLPA
jgi:hypoxanthine phosphoribosyltransferase